MALLVYVHDDEQAAARNATVLEDTLTTGESFNDGLLWADHFSGVAVSAEGRVVTARLRLSDARAARVYDLISTTEPTLFTHR